MVNKMVNGIIFTATNMGVGTSKPIGAYIIASKLRQEGISCQVINYFDYLTIDEIKEIAKKFVSNKTKFIGFSSTFFNNDAGHYYYNDVKLFPHSKEYMIEFFEIFKNINPNILFIYGGQESGNILNYNHNYIDLFVSGPAEYFLPKFLKNKIKTHNFISCSKFPDNFSHDIFKWDKTDIINEDEHLPIETSRGCLFHCAFCKYTALNKYKEKNVNVLKEEIKYNYYKFGIKNYIVVDSLINATYKSTVEKLDAIISLPFKISFSCFGKVSLFIRHPDLREKFLQAGCKYIHFGIESLNNKSLKAIHKHANIEKQIETLWYLKELWEDKLKMTSGFIFGLPYDNQKDIEKWWKFLRSKENPLYEYHTQALSISKNNSLEFLSPISKNPKKYGYILTNDKREWISTTSDMTRLKALEMRKKDLNYIKRPFWVFTGQLINVGYEENELEKINLHEPNFYQKVRKMEIKIKNKYIKKLLGEVNE